MISRNCLALAAAASLCTYIGPAAAVAPAATLYGPTPYLSYDDSPFKGLSFSYFHLDDFESGSTPTPGYTSTTGGQIVASGAFTDSVDVDIDGINGSGNAGRSWFSAGSTSKFTFVFNSAVLGSLPTHAGVVWTDVGNVTSGSTGIGDVTFSAFDSGDSLIQSINGFNMGDSSVAGATAEDRCFGIYFAGGISRIEISMANSQDWEVDHLQYGTLNPIPEPEQWLLMALGVAAVAGAVRRRKVPVTPA